MIPGRHDDDLVVLLVHSAGEAKASPAAAEDCFGVDRVSQTEIPAGYDGRTNHSLLV